MLSSGCQIYWYRGILHKWRYKKQVLGITIRNETIQTNSDWESLKENKILGILYKKCGVQLHLFGSSTKDMQEIILNILSLCL